MGFINISFHYAYNFKQEWQMPRFYTRWSMAFVCRHRLAVLSRSTKSCSTVGRRTKRKDRLLRPCSGDSRSSLRFLAANMQNSGQRAAGHDAWSIVQRQWRAVASFSCMVLLFALSLSVFLSWDLLVTCWGGVCTSCPSARFHFPLPRVVFLSSVS